MTQDKAVEELRAYAMHLENVLGTLRSVIALAEVEGRLPDEARVWYEGVRRAGVGAVAPPGSR